MPFNKRQKQQMEEKTMKKALSLILVVTNPRGQMGPLLLWYVFVLPYQPT